MCLEEKGVLETGTVQRLTITRRLLWTVSTVIPACFHAAPKKEQGAGDFSGPHREKKVRFLRAVSVCERTRRSR